MYGLDRQALVDDVLHGQGLVAHSPVMPNSWAYNEEVTRYIYDPALGRQLLEQAGWIDNDGDGADREGVRMAFVLLGRTRPSWMPSQPCGPPWACSLSPRPSACPASLRTS